MAASRESFPFPLRYQTTWVQLGLLGTLWSFLLIGNRWISTPLSLSRALSSKDPNRSPLLEQTT